MTSLFDDSSEKCYWLAQTPYERLRTVELMRESSGYRPEELDGIPVNLISVEHLKSNKRVSRRHKDLNDLKPYRNGAGLNIGWGCRP